MKSSIDKQINKLELDYTQIKEREVFIQIEYKVKYKQV